MSVFLYRMGTALARRRGLVIGGWLLVLAGVMGSSMTLGDTYDDSFSIPGTQSQEGQDILLDRFDQSGTSAQVVFTTTSGSITASAQAGAVRKIAAAIDAVPKVSMANPLGPPPGQAKPILSKDGASTLGQALFDQKIPSDKTLQAVQEAARPPAGSAITSSVGGDAYKEGGEPSKVPELLGLMVSFLILALTFGSLVAAGMPILTALIGVLTTLSAVVLVSHTVTVSSTSPTLAEMLGLAVGIDYALFILSRYRRQLEDPTVTTAVAMSRALATAGSAVVFAGTTVIIALGGLMVADIPVLTVMGLAAAASVAVAVTIALTLLPGTALLFGERLRPRPRAESKSRLRRRARPKRPTKGFPTRWVHLVTAKPVLTVAAVVGILLLATVPAARLDLALPDNSTAPVNTPQRQTYDAITAAFGEGYNAPLVVTAGVITSTDPSGTVTDLAKAIDKLPGVVAVPQATPNESADTALIQVIPERGQTARSTAALVTELREQAPSLEKRYAVTQMLVTGPTAINIDVSDRLGAALLPFAAIVIGLSMVLLMIVFRSLAVPLKATLGYLLSVGAALGAVVLVFQDGVLDAVLPGLADGPIVSFLPIFVMGVLFGLAMDYEMFLVSAMREEFVAHGDARDAVIQGFKASSIVVTAAALIMTSVFVAFIPGGSSTIKPIAFGLATGVLVDAFIVRMTLVPAVLVLLGRRAWWLPALLDAKVPTVDVEGAAMHRLVRYQDWERANGPAALVGRQVVVTPGGVPVDVEAPPGVVTVVDVAQEQDAAALALVLVGRRRPVGGDLVVGGLLLPEQAAAVHTRAAYVEVGRPVDDERTEAEQVHDRARLGLSSRRHRDAFVARAEDLLRTLHAAAGSVDGQGGPVGRAVTGAAVLEVALAVAGGVSLVVLSEEGAESNVPPGTAAALAAALAQRRVSAVLLRPEHVAPRRPTRDLEEVRA